MQDQRSGCWAVYLATRVRVPSAPPHGGIISCMKLKIGDIVVAGEVVGYAYEVVAHPHEILPSADSVPTMVSGEVNIEFAGDRAALYMENLFQALHLDRPTVGVEVQHVLRRRDHFDLTVDQIAWHLELARLRELEVRASELSVWWKPWCWSRAARLVLECEALINQMLPFPTAETRMRYVCETIDAAALEPEKPIPVVARNEDP